MQARGLRVGNDGCALASHVNVLPHHQWLVRQAPPPLEGRPLLLLCPYSPDSAWEDSPLQFPLRALPPQTPCVGLRGVLVFLLVVVVQSGSAGAGARLQVL